MSAPEDQKARAIDENSRDETTRFQERDELRLTEISYHRWMNRAVALIGVFVFAFFAAFHFYFGNTVQGLIYTLLFINVVGAIIAGTRIEDVDKLVVLKRSTGGVGFVLLASSLIAGVLSANIYVFLPWLLTYPVGVALFFGKRIGIYSAIVFSIVAAIVVFTLQLPPWDADNVNMFKLNTILALLGIMTLAVVGEKSRTRIQEDLVASEQQYKSAEARQRQANVHLQEEIDLRIASEKLLRQSEIRYRALFEESAVSLWEEDWSQLKIYLDDLPSEAADDLPAYFSNDPKQVDALRKMMRITGVNRATLSLFGADTTAALLNNLPGIIPLADNRDYFKGRIVELYRKGRFETEIQVHLPDDTPLHLLVSSTIPAGFQSSWEKVFTSVYDVTERVTMEEERKRVERQLNEARQMQAIATMAGGIAHQFNNALSAIYGNLELMEMESPSPKGLQYINALKQSSDRMSMLTDQLLAYARGGKYLPKAFSVNELIDKLLQSERIEPGPSIEICLNLAPDIYTTSGDTAQIKMVIEAVVSNALESMTAGGRLTIATQNLEVPAEPACPAALPDGRYAMLQIVDSGTGMDEQTRQRIFEPFFTTKFFGRGLGMAAAYGIVQNHNGLITVESTPGQGTGVTIYLPGDTDNGSRARSAA